MLFNVAEEEALEFIVPIVPAPHGLIAFSPRAPDNQTAKHGLRCRFVTCQNPMSLQACLVVIGISSNQDDP